MCGREEEKSPRQDEGAGITPDYTTTRDESTETNGELFPVMIDPVAFDHKPTNLETGGITNRLKKTMCVLVTAEQLRDAIIHGHTCCYGCFEQCADGQKFGHSKFIGQRLMAVDIDNAHEDKTPISFWEHGFLDVPRAIDRCLHGLGQLPLIVYESFNSTETHPKFRLVLDLGEQITDYGEAHEQILDVLALFPEADRNGKCALPDCLFFGTTPANGQYWSSDRLKGWS